MDQVRGMASVSAPGTLLLRTLTSHKNSHWLRQENYGVAAEDAETCCACSSIATLHQHDSSTHEKELCSAGGNLDEIV